MGAYVVFKVSKHLDSSSYLAFYMVLIRFECLLAVQPFWYIKYRLSLFSIRYLFFVRVDNAICHSSAVIN